MAIINGDPNDNLLIGTADADTITADAGNDIVTGKEGNDEIYGGDGIDLIFGDEGNDIIFGGVGDDRLFGGEGNDTIIGEDFLVGGTGNDTLVGDSTSDVLIAGTGFDQMHGLGGDDILIGKSTVFSSRTDRDSAIYTLADAGITAVLSGGLNSLESFVTSTGPGDAANIGTDTLINIDAIRGSAFDDTITITNTYRGMYNGYDGAGGVQNVFNIVEGGDGNDTITGNGYTRLEFRTADGAVTVDLGAGTSNGSAIGGATNVGSDTFSGANQVSGSNFDDTIIGSNSAIGESFRGQAGDDTIDGLGGGADRADYRNASSGIIADLSAGLIGSGTVDDGYGTQDTLINIENLRGSEFNDIITMDDGDNVVSGRDGNDTIFGLGGNDTIYGGLGDDYIEGGAGDDILDASSNGFDRLVGGAGNDILIGGGDAISGNGTRAEYSTATAGVTVNLTGGIGSFASSVTGDASVGTDTLDSIERVRGTNFDDVFIVDASFEGEYGDFVELEGITGDDTFTGNGNTRIRYTTADGAMTIDLDAGTAQGSAVGGATNQGIDTIVSGVNQVRGGDFDDTLLGSNGGQFERFIGEAGNDTIDGRAGSQDEASYRTSNSGIDADLSLGAIGSGSVDDGLGGIDTLIGIERIQGSDFSDLIVMDDGDNRVTGRGGNDDIFGAGGDDTLLGLGGRDDLYGEAGSDILQGGDDNDRLYGGDNDDTLEGGDGFDRYIGGAGNDTLIGGNSGEKSGGDRAEYSSATAGINVNLTGALGSFASTVVGDASVGTDTLDSIEIIRGSDFNDTFVADASFEGEFGSFNEFEGRDGNDSITGNGNTRVSYAGADGAVTVDLIAGTGTGSLGGATNVGTDTFTGINAVRGSAHDDTILGSDSASFENFRGQGGNDTIDGRGGDLDRADYRNSPSAIIADLAAGTVEDGFGTVDTLSNIEQIRGSEYNDVILMDNGNNRVIGRAGDDIIIAFNGDDDLVGGLGADMIDAGDGDDTITGGANDDTADGGVGDDTFIAGWNIIDAPETTDDGDDVYSGGVGIDTVDYTFSYGDISVDLSDPEIGIAFGEVIGTDILFEIENVIGGSGDDEITGGVGNSVLEGGFGDDILTGGEDLVSFNSLNVGVTNFSKAQGWSTFEDFPRLLGDVDGDGAADIVGFGFATTFSSLSNGDGTFAPVVSGINNFANAQGWASFEQFPRLLGDIDGDGDDDIIGFGAATTFSALSNGDGTFAPVQSAISNFANAQGWASYDDFPRLLGDVDGDGNADIVGFGANTTFTALSNGDGTFAPVQSGIANFSQAQGWSTFEEFPRLLGDFDGDGDADIVGFGANTTFTALSNGDGTFAPVESALGNFALAQGWASYEGFPRTVGDVNGDGNDDLIGFGANTTFAALSNGDGTFAPVESILGDFSQGQGWASFDNFPRFADDVNGDGVDDLVGFGASATLVYQAIPTVDIFVFSEDDFGQDTITDFGDGLDQIDLSDTSFDFSDLTITSINGGADTLIDAPGADNDITLTGVSSSVIDQSDFLF